MLFCFCRNRHFDGALRRIHGRNFQYGHGLDLVAVTIAPRIRSCRLWVSDQIENLNRSFPRCLPFRLFHYRNRLNVPRIASARLLYSFLKPFYISLTAFFEHINSSIDQT